MVTVVVVKMIVLACLASSRLVWGDGTEFGQRANRILKRKASFTAALCAGSYSSRRTRDG